MVDILIWLAIALAALVLVSSVIGLIWFIFFAIQIFRDMPKKGKF